MKDGWVGGTGRFPGRYLTVAGRKLGAIQVSFFGISYGQTSDLKGFLKFRRYIRSTRAIFVLIT